MSTEWVATVQPIIQRIADTYRVELAARIDRTRLIKELLDAGASLQSVAEALHVSTPTVHRFARAAGWEGTGAGHQGRCVSCGTKHTRD